MSLAERSARDRSSPTHDEGTRRVEFTIRDHGHWTPRAAAGASRGHGIMIMRACAEDVTIERTTAGTTVTLRSLPVPRSPRRAL